MSRLPHLSVSELIKYLQKFGFEVARQRGSHIVLKRKNKDNTETGTVVPNHKELATGTFLGILKQCGITPDEFMDKYSD